MFSPRAPKLLVDPVLEDPHHKAGEEEIGPGEEPDTRAKRL